MDEMRWSVHRDTISSSSCLLFGVGDRHRILYSFSKKPLYKTLYSTILTLLHDFFDFLIFWIVHSIRPPWKHHVNLIQIFKKNWVRRFFSFWFFQKKIWDPGSQDPGMKKRKRRKTRNPKAKKEKERRKKKKDLRSWEKRSNKNEISKISLKIIIMETREALRNSPIHPNLA